MRFCGFLPQSVHQTPNVFLCFCVFFFRKTQKHIDQMFLCLFSTLGLHQTAYVFLCFCVFFRKIQKHIDQMFLCLFLTLGLHQTAYVFLCFCVFFRKTQKHIDPFFFFFPTIRLHQRANVFLSFCVFFSEKHKNTLTKCFFVFFLTLWLHQTAYVFLCFCVFFRKTQKHIDPILLKVDCGRKFAILSISVWPKKFKCRRNMKSCTFKQKPHQNCSQFLLQEWREESFSSGYQKYYMVDWTFCWIAKKNGMRNSFPQSGLVGFGRKRRYNVLR